jgi:sulfatase modifying factor 1
MEHPCAVGLDCVSGVCTWPGFVPFFACETGRGMRTSEVDFGYQPGDRRGLAEVTYDFDMMPTEVTQADWEALFGENPAFFDECGADCPVENVTWWSAVAYANALSESWGEAPCYVLPDSCTGDAALGTLTCTEAVQLNNTSARYWDCGGARLPTEYEWEVAATGMGFDLPWGTLGPSERLDCVAPDVVFDPVANYCANSELGADACSSYGLPADCLGTQPVAQRLETGWGVYDILGNVAEWTWGERGGYERSNLETPTQNPVYVPRLGPMVVRGGSFGSSPRELHVARRDTRAADYRGADVGLRLVRTRP